MSAGVSAIGGPRAGTAAAVAPVQSTATADGLLHPSSPDVIEILSFSAIMLNTDAHNPSVRRDRKMTREQFVSNNRGIDAGGRDLPRAFLEGLYDAIAGNEIKMKVGAGAAAAAGTSSTSSTLLAPWSSSAATAGGPPTAAALLGQAVEGGFNVDGGAVVDAPSYVRQLGITAQRWLAHAAATAAMDDAAAAPHDVELTADAMPDKAAVAQRPSPRYRRRFSTTTVSCALADLWPFLTRFIGVLLRIPHAAAVQRAAAASTAAASAPASSRGLAAALPRTASQYGGAPSASTATVGRSSALSGLSTLFSFGSAANSSPSASSARGDPAFDLGSDISVAALHSAPASEVELRLLALDALKYALSASLFLESPAHVLEGADMLLQVEAALCGLDEARRAKSRLDGWHNIVCAFAKKAENASEGGGSSARGDDDAAAVAMAVSAIHVTVERLREHATTIAEAATVAHTAARFKGDLARALVADAAAGSGGAGVGPRRQLYEGDLTKVASGGTGKHTVYRFFLFNDMLVYAQRASGGWGSGGADKLTVHQQIPLRGITRITPDPPQLVAAGIAHGFRVDTIVKPLFLVAPNEDELKAWRRHIREAVDAVTAQHAEPQSSAPPRNATGSAPSLQSKSSVGRMGEAAAATAPQPSPNAAAPMATTSSQAKKAVAAVPAAAVATAAAPHPAGATVAPPPPAPAAPAAAAPSSPAIGSPGRPVSSPVVTRGDEMPSMSPEVAQPKHTASDDGTISTVAPHTVPLDSPLSPAVPQAVVSTGEATKGLSGASGDARSADGDVRVTAGTATVPAVVGSPPASVVPPRRVELYESMAALKAAFLAAVSYTRPLLADGVSGVAGASGGAAGTGSSGVVLDDADRLRFYALFKQATSGDYVSAPGDADDGGDGEAAVASTDADATAAAKKRAWAACRGLRRREAMRQFVMLLDSVTGGTWDSRATGVAQSSAAADAAPMS